LYTNTASYEGKKGFVSVAGFWNFVTTLLSVVCCIGGSLSKTVPMMQNNKSAAKLNKF